MPIATYKDLCIDAVDPIRLGEFWAAALALAPTRLDDGDLRLDGPTPQHGVWINRVPEPVTVKQRVHLDVHTGSVDELLAAGATSLDVDSFRWKVLRDPDGGELCAFERDPVPAYKLYEVVVDSNDPAAIATWWAEVLGATIQHAEEHSWFEDAPHVPFDCFVFVPVPEPKTVKNRIHWDVDTDDLQGLLDRGATILREPDDAVSWHVMADPEGNEFCAFLPRE